MLHRYPHNPILTRADIPDVSPFVRDVTSVFNPGAIKLDDRYLLLLRVQTRGRETVLMVAESRDGVEFAVRPQVVEIEGAAALDPRPIHIYDPRITRVDDEVYVVASVDTETGCHLLLTRMEEDLRLRVVSFSRDRQARNGVLFPARIAGRYCRLERPNQTQMPSGTWSGNEICLATSDDLVDWRIETTVMAGRPRFWDELIGSGPPPVKTRGGWLHIYHGIATHLGGAIYQAGVCLLDLEEPSRVVARGRNNILEPRELYEMVGQVPNVVFPSGLIVDEVDDGGFARPNGRVLLYYGAADTCVGLAQTTIEHLLDACNLE
jgi:beta-1,4-mannooligosaccharide/beta-1,4-mannosyl-N-acetylglucosamine phosphorylase